MGFWDNWDDAKSTLTGEKSGSQQRTEQQRRQQYTDKTREANDRFGADGDKHSQDAGGGYDPASIEQHDNWSSWDHKQMKTMVDGIDTDKINQTGMGWMKVGQRLTTSFTAFSQNVSGAVNGGWSGDAANAASKAPAGMAKWGQSVGAASYGTGDRVDQASLAVLQARANMPEPKDFSWRRTLVNGAGGLLGGLGGGLISGGADAYQQHQEQQAAKQQAVDVMNRMYTQGFVEADRTTPAFVEPDDGRGPTPPIIELPPEPPPIRPPAHPPTHRGGGGGDDGTTKPGSNGHDSLVSRPGQPGNPGITDPSSQNIGTDMNGNWTARPPGTTDPNFVDPNTGGPGGVQTGIDGRGPAGGGTAGGMGGGAMGGGMPMMGGGGGFGGSGDSEYGGRGYGSGSGGASGANGSGANSGAGARSGIGGSAAQEAAMGARGGSAGAGRGGGGMGGGGRGGRKEEDTEHQTPDYLVETDDVFGSGEMVAPPVIGE